jgi:membrane protease subunit HflC
MRKFLVILLVIVLVSPLLFRLALSTILVPVDRTEFVYVTQFGKHVASYDGAKDDDAGLHWRWPWPVQSVLTLDRRLQSFDLPGKEVLTQDPKRNTPDRTLTIVAYVCWRISDDEGGVDWFVRRVGTPERARTILGQRISSQFGAVVGQMELDDLISDTPGKVESNMEKLRQRLMASLQQSAKDDYGIDLVDIRLRRHSYPPAVLQEIFLRIASERNKKVEEYKSEGDQRAAHIRSVADLEARQVVTEAKAEEQRLKSEAERKADMIRNEAQIKDPEFYAFLRKLEEYQRILGDNKTILLLSAHRAWFDLLFQPPMLNGANSPGKPVAGSPDAKPAPSDGGR